MSSDIDIEEHDLLASSAARLQALAEVKTEVLDVDDGELRHISQETPFEYEYEESPLTSLYDEVPDSTTDLRPPSPPLAAPSPPPDAHAPAPSPHLVTSTREDDQHSFTNNCIIIGSKPNPVDESFSKVQIDCRSLQRDCATAEELFFTPEEEFPTAEEDSDAADEDYTTEEIDLEHCYSATVVLRDWGAYLAASDGYCAKCQVLFPTGNALDAHKMAAHSFLVAVARSPEPERALVVKKDCFVCKKQFSNEKDLIKHIYLHVSTSQACPLCEETFYSKQLLEDHVTSAHPAPAPAPPAAPAPRQVYRCAVCYHYYNSFQRLSTHALRNHRQRLEAPPRPVALSLQCALCPSRLATFKSYNIHITTIHQDLYKRVATKATLSVGKQFKLKVKHQPKTGTSITKPRNDVRTLIAKNALFQCTQCGLHTPDLVSYGTHMRACAGECGACYACAACGLHVARRFDGLHRRQHREGRLAVLVWGATPDTTLLQCLMCRVHFQLARYRLHVRSCEPGAQESVHCDPCGVALAPSLAASHATLHAVSPQQTFTYITFHKKTSLDTSATSVYKFCVCRTCRCCMQEPPQHLRHHQAGRCRDIKARACSHCALRLSKNAMRRHERLHDLLPKFTLSNFRFRWLGDGGGYRGHADFFSSDDAPTAVETSSGPTVVPLEKQLVYKCGRCGTCIEYRSVMRRHLVGAGAGARCRRGEACARCHLRAPHDAASCKFDVKQMHFVVVSSVRDLQRALVVYQCAACRYHTAERAYLTRHWEHCSGEVGAPEACARCRLPVRRADRALHDREIHDKYPDLDPTRVIVRPGRWVPSQAKQEKIDQELSDVKKVMPVDLKVLVKSEVEQIDQNVQEKIPLKMYNFYQCTGCKIVLFNVRKNVGPHSCRCTGQANVFTHCERCGVALRRGQLLVHQRLHETFPNITKKNTRVIPFRPSNIKHLLEDKPLDAKSSSDAGVVTVTKTAECAPSAPARAPAPAPSFSMYQCVECRAVLHGMSNIARHRALCRGQPQPAAPCHICNLHFCPTKLFKHISLHDKYPDMTADNIRIVKFSSKHRNKVILGSKLSQTKTKNRLILGSKVSQTKNKNKIILGSKLSQTKSENVAQSAAGTSSAGSGDVKHKILYTFYECQSCKMQMQMPARHSCEAAAAAVEAGPARACRACGVRLVGRQHANHRRLHARHPALCADNIRVLPFRPSPEASHTLAANKTSKPEFKFYQCQICKLVTYNIKKHKKNCKITTRPLIKCKKCLVPLRAKQMESHLRLHREHPGLTAGSWRVVPFAPKTKKTKPTSVPLDMKQERWILYQCPSCHVCFESRSSAEQHQLRADCRQVRYKRCRLCSHRISHRLVKAHHARHRASPGLQVFLKRVAPHAAGDASPRAEPDTVVLHKCPVCELCQREPAPHDCEADRHTCGACGRQVPAAELSAHESAHQRGCEFTVSMLEEPVPLYRCARCDVHFLTAEDGAQHAARHSDRSPRAPCPRCGLHFYQRSLRTHTRLHHELNNYGVDNYDIRDIDDSDSVDEPLSELVNRKRKHDGEMVKAVKSVVYRCNSCRLSFVCQFTARRHRAACGDAGAAGAGGAGLACSKCSLVFDLKQLLQHSLKHHGVRAAALRVVELGPEGDSRLYHCTQCGFNFMNMNTLCWHRTPHRRIVAPHRCTHCRLLFSKTTLLKHTDLHHMKNNYSLEDIDFVDEHCASVPLEKILLTVTDKHSSQPDLEESQSAADTAGEVKAEANLPDVVAMTGGEANDADKSEAKPTEVLEYYRCRDCAVAFLDRDKCEQHVEDHTPMEEYDFVECKICKINFDLEALKTHMTHHRNQLFSVDSVKWLEYFIKGDPLDAASGNENELNSCTTSVNDDEMEADEILGT